jgi:hypothetical protein
MGHQKSKGACPDALHQRRVLGIELRRFVDDGRVRLACFLVFE